MGVNVEASEKKVAGFYARVIAIKQQINLSILASKIAWPLPCLQMVKKVAAMAVWV